MDARTEKLKKEIRVLSLTLFIVVLLILLIGAGIARRVIKTSGTRLFNRFLSDCPVKLLEPVATLEERNQLSKKQAVFSGKLKKTTGNSSVVLSKRELNIIIAGNKYLKNRFRIMQIDKEKIVTLVSLQFFTGSKMQYLNGVASIKPEYKGGYLRLSPETFRSGGKEFPKKLLWVFKNVNLLASLYSTPFMDSSHKLRLRKYISNLSAIEMEDGQIVVRG